MRSHTPIARLEHGADSWLDRKLGRMAVSPRDERAEQQAADQSAAERPSSPPTTWSAQTSSELAYEITRAMQRVERRYPKPDAWSPPRSRDKVATRLFMAHSAQEYVPTWSDITSIAPRFAPPTGDSMKPRLHTDSRSPPNYAQGSHAVGWKDSALIPRVERHDLEMRYMGHTRSSDRAPHARVDLW